MSNKKVNYRVLSVELDEILTKLQSNDLDVDEAIKLYERGMEVAKEIEKYLKEAENKITKIKTCWQSEESV